MASNEEPVVIQAVDEEKEEVEQLKGIADDLEVIKSKVQPSRWRVLRNGMYQGAGVVIGGALAVVLVGWILAFLGFIPGLHETAEYLQSIVDKQR